MITSCKISISRSLRKINKYLLNEPKQLDSVIYEDNYTYTFVGARLTHLITTIPPSEFCEVYLWINGYCQGVLANLEFTNYGCYTVITLPSTRCTFLEVGKEEERGTVFINDKSEYFYGRSRIVNKLVPETVHCAESTCVLRYENINVCHQLLVCTEELIFERERV